MHAEEVQLPLGCISVWVEVFEQVRYYLSSDGTSSRQVWSFEGLPSSLPTLRYLIRLKTLALLDACPVACILVIVSVPGVWIKPAAVVDVSTPEAVIFLTMGKNLSAVCLVLRRCLQRFRWPACFTSGEHTLHWSQRDSGVTTSHEDVYDVDFWSQVRRLFFFVTIVTDEPLTLSTATTVPGFDTGFHLMENVIISHISIGFE